jgi:hypothetical protein
VDDENNIDTVTNELVGSDHVWRNWFK